MVGLRESGQIGEECRLDLLERHEVVNTAVHSTSTGSLADRGGTMDVQTGDINVLINSLLDVDSLQLS